MNASHLNALTTKVSKYKGVWKYTVECPYCKKHHSHLCGSAEEPAVLGERRAICKKGSYELNPWKDCSFKIEHREGGILVYFN